MSIYIEKVRIRNFRALRDVEVTLSPNVTLLVGANNAGKTTFLRALSLAFNPDKRFISQDDLFVDKNGQSLAENRAITIDVKIVPNPTESKIEEGVLKFNVEWAEVFKTDIKPTSKSEVFAYRTVIDFGQMNQDAKPRRYTILDWDAENISDDLLENDIVSSIPFHFMDAQRDLHSDSQLRTSYFGKMTSKIQYDDEKKQALEQQLAALNNEAISNSEILKCLRDNLEELNKTVQSRGRGVEITPFPKNLRDLNKGMKVHFQDGESDTFSLEYHGMGTRSWASLLSFKAKIKWDKQEKEEGNQPFFPILGLEEPEAHLHPNAQRQVYQQLADITGQKIISTHSPYIAAQAKLDEIRYFSKFSDITLVRCINTNLFVHDDLRKIQREVVQTKGELLFSRAIVLFEGETESQLLPIFAFKYFNTHIFSQGITFISVDGNNYKPFVLLAEELDIPWFIFSDYDKQSIKNGVDNLIVEIGLDPLISDRNVIKLEASIEQYLISEGYQEEIKAGIKKCFIHSCTEETDPRQIEAGNRTIDDYDDIGLLKKLTDKHSKVRYPSFYADVIANLPDDRAIPPKIRQLFDAINQHINLPNQQSGDNHAPIPE